MPDHDLAELWEAHCRHEFETRNADATMATMVDDPTSTTSRPRPAGSAATSSSGSTNTISSVAARPT